MATHPPDGASHTHGLDGRHVRCPVLIRFREGRAPYGFRCVGDSSQQLDDVDESDGGVCHFRLRGMKLTLAVEGAWRSAAGQHASGDLALTAVPDPGVHTAIAEAPVILIPRATVG